MASNSMDSENVQTWSPGDGQMTITSRYDQRMIVRTSDTEHLVGPLNAELLQIFETYMNLDAFLDSPEDQAPENPATPTAGPIHEITLPGTPPQSEGTQSPPSSPPPSYRAGAGTGAPAWQAPPQPHQLMQIAQSGGIPIILPRYTNTIIPAHAVLPTARALSTLEQLYGHSPHWRPLVNWVSHHLKYRLPRREFWLDQASLMVEICQEIYVYGLFQGARLGTHWRPGPEYIQDNDGTLLHLGSIERPPAVVLNNISLLYGPIQAWYTDAMLQHVFPRLQNGEYGNPESFHDLLIGDRIFDLPPFILGTIYMFGGSILGAIVSQMFLGLGGYSILHHWERLSEPFPMVPPHTVALACTYAVWLVLRLKDPNLPFSKAMFQPVYNRALARWRDMLANPALLQEFLRVESAWMHLAPGP